MQIFLYVLGAILLLGALILAIFRLCPRFGLRCAAFLLRHTFFRIRIAGAENIPGSGPVLLVSNHVSLLDLIWIQSACKRRRVRFMVHQNFFDIKPFGVLLRFFGVICVPDSRHPKAMRRFFTYCRLTLRKGEVLCFFPEGGISGSGGLMRFRSGVAPLLPPGNQTTILPLRIGMLRGRLLTASDNTFRIKFPHSLPVDFNVTVGKPIAPDLTAFQLRQKLSELGADAELGPQPGELPIHTAFIKQAKKHPFRKIYIDAETGGVANFTIMVRSIVLSRLIRSLNTGNSGYVGALLPNCTIMTSILHGILMSDHTPAVINFSSGRDVALEAARRAGVSLILTSRKFLAKLDWEPAPEMVMLEDLAPKVSPSFKRAAILKSLLLPWRTLARRVAPTSAFNVQREAVLLFSSGSTGKPKAVMLTHRNINCDIFSFWRVIDWSIHDVIAGNLPMFHAYGFMTGFAFMGVGGTPVVYVTNPLDSAGIMASIAKYKVTLLTATPTFLLSYIRKAKPEQLNSLRLVVTGAEKLRPELSKRFRELSGARLDVVEGYGCTELSPIVSINLCNSIFRLGKRADHPGSIGMPLPGIHTRVVDPETGVEMGENESGRLQVKGGTVMKGYLNEPGLTAQVIQDGYYDTGDIAKIDREGYIYITGRASRFSKIGGEMVPHELVEQTISRLRGSEDREVVVTGRPDARRGERLVVFYTPEDLNPTEIVAGLRNEKLPNLWIPKAEDFCKIDKLPILGSGKLDLRKLKEMAEGLE
ncbi:MAG: AMP-binding protein [Victivallaceae bacterium]|nr:AMP-binding protein [Victivallaceae bacterium]